MYCKAITKKGHVCSCKALDGHIHCKRHSKINYPECAICYDNIYLPVKLTSCGHTFCKHCISICGNSCPLCRTVSCNVKSQNELFDGIFKKLSKLITDLDYITCKHKRILAIKHIYDIVFNNYHTLFHNHQHLLDTVVSKFIDIYNNSDNNLIFIKLNAKMEAMIEKLSSNAHHHLTRRC